MTEGQESRLSGKQEIRGQENREAGYQEAGKQSIREEEMVRLRSPLRPKRQGFRLR
jgi:hypothetical protein